MCFCSLFCLFVSQGGRFVISVLCLASCLPGGANVYRLSVVDGPFGCVPGDANVYRLSVVDGPFGCVPDGANVYRLSFVDGPFGFL